MTNNGWIKLHTSILEWEWFKDTNTFALFIHLLLTVNWKDGRWMGTEIKRGQRITSLPILAQETGLSIQCVRTAIKHLKSTGEVTCSQHRSFSLLTVTNFDKYQSTNTLPNRELTGSQQGANNNIRYIDKEDIKIIKEIYKEKFEDFWSLYPRKIGKDNAYKSWLKLSSEDRQKCIEVIPVHSKQKQWESKEYIPHPATWLNQGRWKDDVQDMAIKRKVFQCKVGSCVNLTENPEKICDKCTIS